MSDTINQQEINQILWRACDTFRGTVDPSEYKNYILVMLFVKYISDVWHDHYQEYAQRYGDDEERTRRRLRYESFRLPCVSSACCTSGIAPRPGGSLPSSWLRATQRSNTWASPTPTCSSA